MTGIARRRTVRVMRTTRLAAVIAATVAIAVLPVAAVAQDASAPPSVAPAPLPSPFPDAQPLLVPQLVVTIGMPGLDASVAIVAPFDGSSKRLAAGSDPWPDPDGRHLLYTCAPADPGSPRLGVCELSLAGDAAPRTLIAKGDRPTTPQDGSLIAYHRGMVDVGETWIARRDGTGATRLAAGDLRAWSADGTMLAGQADAVVSEVAVVPVAGGEPRILSIGDEVAWWPAGPIVAFRASDGVRSSIVIADARQDAAQLAYRAPEGMTIDALAWLPDDALAFVMDGDLWRLDYGAVAPVPLTDGLAIDGSLSVSADGGWIAFTTPVDGVMALGIASPYGGWRILDLGPDPVTQPAWLPYRDPTRAPAG